MPRKDQINIDIVKAHPSHLETIEAIVKETINHVYPHYYPGSTVNFFLAYHNQASILTDIQEGNVFILSDESGNKAGTVTIRENEISRLYVLPQYQRNGFGSALLAFAEDIISEQYSTGILEASLPSREIYLKKGYTAMEFRSVETDAGDFLCYDIMYKHMNTSRFKINYDGKIFFAESNSENGEVDTQTIFHYHQKGEILWAEYSGGEILKGHLTGLVREDGVLDFSYQHINENLQLRIGTCHSTPSILENGKVKLEEVWKWLNGDESAGTSILMER